MSKTYLPLCFMFGLLGSHSPRVCAVVEDEWLPKGDGLSFRCPWRVFIGVPFACQEGNRGRFVSYEAKNSVRLGNRAELPGFIGLQAGPERYPVFRMTAMSDLTLILVRMLAASGYGARV